ncbi:MAG TPA: DUF3866 family protein [Actinomycetota bacterium]|nr:DUF3866 family protein [Actinomycetota bacterium]
MIRIRRGLVRQVRERHAGLLDVEVEIDGTTEAAVAYPDLCGPVTPGDRVVLNTTAVSLGLGTGGVHFVIAVEGGSDLDPGDGVHAIKLRYTPVQVAVRAIEEGGAPLPEDLDGMPVVAAGLHSAIAPVAIAAHAISPGIRIGLVITDAAALPLAFGDSVPALRAAGLIAATVTCGQAFGGDVEAINKYSGMLAARAAGAQMIIVAMGPGNLGTGSRYGFAGMEVAEVVNAVAALGGSPVAVPRIGFGDPRDRHRGVSHHTITALGDAAFASAIVALPPYGGETGAAVRGALAPLARRHRIREIDLGPAEQALRDAPVPMRTMGRSFDEEPEYFRTAAAAGVLAARMAAGEQ